MSDNSEWRRRLPPPRRKPNLIMVLARWRVEIPLGAAAVAVLQTLGPLPFALVVGASAVGIAMSSTVRRGALTVWQTVVVPHRVRSALVHAGVANLDGRLPWLLYSRPAGMELIRVEVWLRSGIVTAHVRGAADDIATACGARTVEVIEHSLRPDRVTVIVAHARWGTF
jgi:hypothetical protein